MSNRDEPIHRDTAYGLRGGVQELVQLWEFDEQLLRVSVIFDRRSADKCASKVEIVLLDEDTMAASVFELLWEYPSNWYSMAVDYSTQDSERGLRDALGYVASTLVARARAVLTMDPEES